VSVWWGGRVADDGEVPLAGDRGLLLGDGLFETVLVVDGIARHLDRHLARLAASAAALRLPLPESLASTVAGTLGEMVAREGRPRRGALRITVTRGSGRGLTPSGGLPGLVLGFGALPVCGRDEIAQPAAARIVAAPRIDPRDPLAGHKVLSYMPRVHARREAIERGADVALLTTVDGDVCEADAANLFVVVGGEVVTPPLDRGVLPGITRARCIDALARAGRPSLERPISVGELARADEVFLTSSLDGVRPVSSVDGHGLAAPGPVARWLAPCLEIAEPPTGDLVPSDASEAQNTTG
jgi:branched-chain amino acid aminotransferase